MSGFLRPKRPARAGQKVAVFLAADYEKGSCFAVLQRFLEKQQARGLSVYTVARLYYSLHPIGVAAENAPLAALSTEWLREYLDDLWRTHAPETLRTHTADARQFFKWCKKKGHHPLNIARGIRPVRYRPQRRRRVTAAPEADVRQVMAHLAGLLRASDLVYRDLFRTLQAAETGWTEETVRALRDLLILAFLYETGARVGELSRLGSASMDEAIRQPQSVYQVTVVGKTNDRERYFTTYTAELWRLWQQVRPAQAREFAVVGWRGGREAEAEQMRTNGISQMLERRCIQAGVRPFRAQSLRHAKVKRSRQQVGMELAAVLIDHSTIRSTWNYVNIDDDEISQAVVATGLQTDLWVGQGGE